MNYTIKTMTEALSKLNPNALFRGKDYDEAIRPHIAGTMDGEALNLPSGFYYSKENGITNKGRSSTGVYVSFDYRNIFR